MKDCRETFTQYPNASDAMVRGKKEAKAADCRVGLSASAMGEGRPLPFFTRATGSIVAREKRETSGENHLRPASEPGGDGAKIIAAGDVDPRQLFAKGFFN